jgi:uncharacterized protein YeeX (DUF496 family)
MKVINLSDLKIENLEGEYLTLVINMKCPDLDGVFLENDKTIYSIMRKNFEEYIDDYTITKPVLFQINVETAEKIDEYDIKSVVDMILGSFNVLFVEKERRKRDYRFGLTYIPEFSQIKDTQLHIMKMVNYKTKVDTFSLVIKFEAQGTEDVYYYSLVD